MKRLALTGKFAKIILKTQLGAKTQLAENVCFFTQPNYGNEIETLVWAMQFLKQGLHPNNVNDIEISTGHY